MRIAPALALILSVLCCCLAAKADTRVELIGRVDFNGLQLGNCFNPPCPFQHVRPGEYVHVSFLVNNAGHDVSSQWPDCPNQNPRTIGDMVYDIRNGTMAVRAAGTSLGVFVGTTSGGFTSPAFRVVNDNCSVDVVETQGAVMSRGGRCCYANGSCTYVKQADCGAGGTWTITGVCTTTENSCTQPLGACCDFSNQCASATQEACVNAGSIWSFGACSPTQCPQDVGSCCAANGSCAMTTAGNCEDTWAFGGTCDAAGCARPALSPDYAMDWTIRGPKTLFSNADIAANLGVYNTNQFDPNRSWTIIFQSNEMFIYDGFRMAFSTDTTPTGSCCPGDGHCLVTTQAICPVSSSWVSGGACGPTTCPAGSGACCKPDGTCELLAGASCAAISNAIYKGDSTSCTAGVCPPTGACCNGGGCSSIIQSACVATGGTWLGAGRSCAATAENAVALGNTAGRCCRPNGDCVLAFQTSCAGFGDIFTAGQLCDVPCSGAGACCNLPPNGSCSLVLFDNCVNRGGTWTGAVTCENECADVGACCNAVAGSCVIVPEPGCQAGNTWTPGATCAAACSTGAGKCCNTFSGTCTMTTQAFCSGAWTSGATCATPCVNASATLPDAVFNSAGDIPATWTNTVSVTDAQTVQSVEVWMDLTTSRINDIRVSLTGPNSVTVPLFVRLESKPPFCTRTPVGAGHTLGGVLTFQDNAPMSLFDHVAILGFGTGLPVQPGRYKPSACGGVAASLNSAFGGISAAGNWTITVVDERSGINTTVRSWGVSFNGGNPTPCTVGKCENGASCAVTTFAQCVGGGGAWSTGPCPPPPVTCDAGTPGACCFMDTCVVMCSSLCPTGVGGSFIGSGTACTASACHVACCKADGTCAMMPAFNCSGNPGATGSTCTPNACPGLIACCFASGGCTTTLAAGCIGGAAGAAGSVCTPNTCPRGAGPANDSCVAVSASGPDVVLSAGLFSTVGATMAGATPDGVASSCVAAGGADVWYRFTVPASGEYRVQTCTSPSPVWDTVVSVWSDCVTQVSGACSDDSCGATPTVYGHARVTTPLESGATYLVRVAAFSPMTTGVGNFTLNVTALGACCLTTGACEVRAQSECTGQNEFRGLNTTCSAGITCGQPRACCNPSTLACTTQTPFSCLAQGRIPAAEGVTCAMAPCPVGVCCRGVTCTNTISQFNCVGNANSFVLNQADCNAPGNSHTPCCHGDFDKVDGITITDIFQFLNAWFAQSPFAVYGGDGNSGTPEITHIFQFLNAWFSGCN